MEFAARKELPELREDTKTQIVRILSAWETALATSRRIPVREIVWWPTAVCAGGIALSHLCVEVRRRCGPYMDRMMALPAMRDWLKAAQAEVDAGIV